MYNASQGAAAENATNSAGPSQSPVSVEDDLRKSLKDARDLVERLKETEKDQNNKIWHLERSVENYQRQEKFWVNPYKAWRKVILWIHIFLSLFTVFMSFVAWRAWHTPVFAVILSILGIGWFVIMTLVVNKFADELVP